MLYGRASTALNVRPAFSEDSGGFHKLPPSPGQWGAGFGYGLKPCDANGILTFDGEQRDEAHTNKDLHRPLSQECLRARSNVRFAIGLIDVHRQARQLLLKLVRKGPAGRTKRCGQQARTDNSGIAPQILFVASTT